MSEAYIVSACRTPIGRFGGALSTLSACELGAAAIREALSRAGVDGASVDEVVMGNVLQAGQGQGPARQAALKAGVAVTAPATTVNMVCGSGLKAVTLAAQAVRLGEADCVVAGGMESMSQAAFVLPRNHGPFGNVTLLDLILRDGLTDAFDGRHMALMCERLGEKLGISREEQDEFAAQSQQRCEAAVANGAFEDETAPVTVTAGKETKEVACDEHPRPGTTAESLAKLRPAFEPTGTITAGNASGINDGAAAVVVMSERRVKESGAQPMARIVSWAAAGLEPEMFGVAPAGAVKLALERAGLRMDQIGLIEANEAFALQSIALARQMDWDAEKVNVNGGAIALGHPIGASGARVLTTLLYEMKRQDVRYGLATLCIGGGMGIAAVVESCS